MKFTCDLDLPRIDDEPGVPTAWAQDATISQKACDLLMILLALPRGVEVDEDEVEALRKPGEPPLRAMTLELAHTGYLEWRGGTPDRRGPRYGLVHPERLGPVDAA